MIREPFGVGDYIHVYNCGNRKADIVRDNIDRWRFLAGLRYYNDISPAEFLMRRVFGGRKDRFQSLRKSDFHENFHENLHDNKVFIWPPDIKPNPIVKVISFSLLKNHYHLLLQEITEGGVTEYLRKLGTGYTKYSNIRHNELGKVFQGAYKSKIITDVRYLQYIDIYIQVLNPLEFMGFRLKEYEFEKLFEELIKNPFSGAGESVGERNFSILDRSNFLCDSGLPSDKEKYKIFAKEAILEQGLKKFLGDLSLED